MMALPKPAQLTPFTSSASRDIALSQALKVHDTRHGRPAYKDAFTARRAKHVWLLHQAFPNDIALRVAEFVTGIHVE